ncbi:MAG: VCBS repeat-containing protein [Chthoniobacteraceae bacterium]
MKMYNQLQSNGRVEILESRIAPAATFVDVTGHVGQTIVSATANAPTLLHAGDTLSTSGSGGTYLMYVEQGTALVFNTDLNKNGVVDPNEITGIAAGNGLRLISFVNIHGDIVTDLNANGTLTDSDSNASNNDPSLKGDGRILLNNTIELIEMRSITVSDLAINQYNDTNGDGSISASELNAHLAYSNYSIYGSIYAGAGFGTSDGLNGLIIDTTGDALQATKFNGVTSDYYYQSATPVIGSIRTGTAASGQNFTFGVSNLTELNVGGKIATFTPATGQAGGDITGIHSTNGTASVAFDLDGLFAGNGGFGARGGNITDVVLGGDQAGGYKVIAGDGGNGFNGGAGGSITNFSDLGSSTTDVLIESGNGGVGLTGVGGNGGKIVFTTDTTSTVYGIVNIFGNVTIKLGDGGSGFKAGGSGSSLTTLSFTAGTIVNATPVTEVSTWRDPYSTDGGNLGRVLPIDFNGDGWGDYVYASSTPSQLTVMLSEVVGSTVTWVKDQLDISGVPSAITVGDFNGDGKPDIAVGTSDVGGLSGVSVYFSIWKDTDGNGKLDTFAGFSGQHFNPLPTLVSTPNLSGYTVSGQPITNLVSGDFNHDGVTDVALTATYYAPGVNHPASDVLLFLMGDTTTDQTVTFDSGSTVTTTTGNLYADFSLDGSTARTPGVVLWSHSDTTPVTLVATGLSTGSSTSSDVVFVGKAGDNKIIGYDFSTGDAPNAFVTLSMGQVDTNRNVQNNGTAQVSLVSATLSTFTVGDFNGDGNVDVVALTKTPASFLVDWTGDGTGAFTNQSSSGGNGNQSGIALVGDTSLGAAISDSSNFTPQSLAITTGDAQGSQIAVYGTITSGSHVYATAYTLSLQQNVYGNDPTVSNPGNYNSATVVTALSGTYLGEFPHSGSTIPPFDVFRYDATDSTQIGFTTLLDPDTATNTPGFTIYYVNGTALGQDLFDTGLTLKAGNGGSSVIGAGGNGGVIGGTTAGTITIDGTNFADAVTGSFGFTVVAGNGGSGFTTGGTGGSVSGITVLYTGSYTLPSSLYAGDGGAAIKGTGGTGGGISILNIQDGVVFIAGDGGSGKVGGNGGSVVGQGLNTSPDTSTGDIIVQGGAGGNGITQGGQGGSILKFVASLGITSTGTELSYIAGAGGNAAGGIAGNGGSVLNSSPSILLNGFGGIIDVEAGNGGSGLTGGNGGSITNFINSPTENKTPQLATFFAGDGGTGIIGNGGAGGSILNVEVTATAYDSTTETAGANIIMAGNGGVSFGARGGKGGDLGVSNIANNIIVTAVGGGVIAAAGTGADGLTAGGAGGSVYNAALNASTGVLSGPGAKILVEAGAGGSAYASTTSDIVNLVANTPSLSSWAGMESVIAFGNAHGTGGAGGGINTVTQSGSVSTEMDLIAGNGGSTLNFGTSDPTQPVYVGKGGSINNITLAGFVGNTDQTTAIQSYSSDFLETFRSESMTFTAAPFLGTLPTFSDSDGSVGLVAGAAGSVYGGGASVAAKNGSVNNLTAKGISSMVAGSVDHVAAIQSAHNIALTAAGGVVAANKDGSATYNYIDPNGVTVASFGSGYKLLDGAIYTKSPITNDGVAGVVYIPSVTGNGIYTTASNP